MAADVMDVRAELTARRAVGDWIFLGIVAFGVYGLALQVPDQSTTTSQSPLKAAASLPASLYLDSGHAPLDHRYERAIGAIASAVKSSPMPVVIAAYADPVGNREKNLRRAQKRAADVRDALVSAGVPPLRITLVSPSFAAADQARRVEISLVHGVPAFPAQQVTESGSGSPPQQLGAGGFASTEPQRNAGNGSARQSVRAHLALPSGQRGIHEVKHSFK